MLHYCLLNNLIIFADVLVCKEHLNVVAGQTRVTLTLLQATKHHILETHLFFT